MAKRRLNVCSCEKKTRPGAKKKSVLQGLAVAAVSLAVWCAAYYVCYAYGMRKETGKLAEILNMDSFYKLEKGYRIF